MENNSNNFQRTGFQLIAEMTEATEIRGKMGALQKLQKRVWKKTAVLTNSGAVTTLDRLFWFSMAFAITTKIDLE